MTFKALEQRLRQFTLDTIAAGSITGKQLAQKCGLAQAHISNFLNQRRGLSLEATDILMTALGISVVDLLEHDDKMSAAKQSTLVLELRSVRDARISELEATRRQLRIAIQEIGRLTRHLGAGPAGTTIRSRRS